MVGGGAHRAVEGILGRARLAAREVLGGDDAQRLAEERVVVEGRRPPARRMVSRLGSGVPSREADLVLCLEPVST